MRADAGWPGTLKRLHAEQPKAREAQVPHRALGSLGSDLAGGSATRQRSGVLQSYPCSLLFGRSWIPVQQCCSEQTQSKAEC